MLKNVILIFLLSIFAYISFPKNSINLKQMFSNITNYFKTSLEVNASLLIKTINLFKENFD